MAPNDNRFKLLLAEVNFEGAEPLEALAVLQDVPASAGAPGQVDFLRGRASLLLGNLEAAKPLLDAAVAADPEKLDYLSSFAEVEALQQNYEGAFAPLNKAHEINPGSAYLSYQIAFIDTLAHRYDQAMESCKEATRLAPNFDEAYFLLGAIQFERKAWLSAEADFEHALSLRPRFASYHAALGATLLKAEI